MKTYRGFDDPKIHKAARSVAIGVFDGVHRGHLKIINKMLRDAKASGRRSMVITFDPHPGKILYPSADHRIIMSLPHRLRFFEKLGVDETLVIPFNKKIARVSREKFLHERLIKRLGMKTLVMGDDFRFGYKGLGDKIYLKQALRGLFRLIVVSPLKSAKHIISSTQLRGLIERGDFVTAERMLGRPVSVHGNVVRGRGRGKGLGFPTANLNPHHETLPPSGVYAACGNLDGRLLKGVIHIGQRPTFSDVEKSLEVHFFHFHQNIYGRELELSFVKRLRPIRKFKNPAALARAIRQDIRRAATLLKARI